MFEILVYLFESYIDAGSYPDSEKLSMKLAAAGFEDGDIHLTLTWLAGLSQLSAANYPEAINQSGFRYYADLEIERISDDARRFLVYLEQNDVIAPIEREMIIDRAVAAGHEELSLDKIKLIALMVLWNLHSELDPMLIDELLMPADLGLLH
jgi:Smg protein